MSSNKGDKCGFGSLLPMSCRERAEAFARHLHTRLASLDSEENNDTPSESTWIAANKNSVTLLQPRQAPGTDANEEFYINFEPLLSPGSPTGETGDTTFDNFINEEQLSRCCSTEENIHEDSDSSDGLFYDTQVDVAQHSNTSKTTDENTMHKENTLEALNNNNNDPNSDSGEEICLKCENNPSIVTCESQNETEQPSTKQETSILPSIQVYVDDENELEEHTPRVRRCSSLKTGKTPPGTPGQKKIVRFADVLGLDLADVRTFLDEIPKIPKSAFNDLKEMPTTANVVTPQIYNISSEKMLTPLFQQPGGQPDFIDRIRDNEVCLENAIIVEDLGTLTIKGIVKVKNLDFHKSVHIRYTLDSWVTFADVQAIYVENSCDGFSDKFSFVLFANNLAIGEKLEFAVRFQCKGCQYWDNNYGKNYCFQCLPVTNSVQIKQSIATPEDSWLPSFY